MPDSQISPKPPSSVTQHYRGRFAPSPTGPLHLGSLIAALASYLDARNNRGSWFVRMDDLDPPREVEGAAHDILESLQQHGLHWDGDVLWQSHRHSAYDGALAHLETITFQCDCSRNMLGHNGHCQGACQKRPECVTTPSATRIGVPQNTSLCFNDQIQGPQKVALGLDTPNFLIHRKDGLYAYQLAVVVDDAYQGITHIVRGSDLLETTARQLFLQQALGFPTPIYCHVPVICNAQGQKLSKQNHAAALENKNAAHNLRAALAFLHQTEPPLELDRPGTILEFATQNWLLPRVPAVMAITI